MKLHDWKDNFSRRVLERGENYYFDDAVRSMKWDGKTITATVSGMETYKVKIDVSDGVVGEMRCDCPYEYYCKHMAAVLFAASEDDFPGADGSRQTAGPSLDEAIQSLSASDAKIILSRWAKTYPDIADQILFKVTGGVGKEQVQQWLNHVAELSRQYSDRHGYIEYDRASAYTDAVGEWMNEKASLLLDAGQPMDAFALTCKVCEEIAKVDIDDSNGGIGWLYGECADRWRDILPHTSLEQRREMFDWIQDHYHSWGGYDDPFDAFLFGNSVQEAAFQEPEFLERKLDLLDQEITKVNDPSYSLQRFVLYRLDVMRQLSVSREETERVIQKYYHLPGVRQRLIREAIREERFDDAIALLRRSKGIDAQYPGLVREYSDKLIELFQKLDRTEELRDELLYQMKEVFQKDLEHVNLLKSMTPPEDWPALRDKLLTMRGLSGVDRRLMEQEGLYQRLLESVLRSKNLQAMEQFFNTLSREYPDETRKFYVSCLRSGMEHSFDRTAYAECVRGLKKLEQVRDGKEVAAKLAAEWRTAYPRRRAMLDELKKGGF